MPKSASVYTRVEPEIKEQVEQVLSKLGIPMANAINLFLHQVALQKGLPFDIKLPQSSPLNYAVLSSEQFDAEIEKGLVSLGAGKIALSTNVRDKMKRQYGI